MICIHVYSEVVMRILVTTFLIMSHNFIHSCSANNLCCIINTINYINTHSIRSAIVMSGEHVASIGNFISMPHPLIEQGHLKIQCIIMNVS